MRHLTINSEGAWTIQVISTPDPRPPEEAAGRPAEGAGRPADHRFTIGS